MKTHYSVSYSPDVDTSICIVNKVKTIKDVRRYCKGHASNSDRNFDTTQHHYLITEWDKGDNIINQTNLEELNYYETSRTN